MKQKRLRTFVFVLILATSMSCTSLCIAQTILDVTPVMQQTSSWCWLASGEMVFEYYNIPANDQDFQCGEARADGSAFVQTPYGVAIMKGQCWDNCMNCAHKGSETVIGLFNLIRQYPAVVAITAGNTKMLHARIYYAPLSVNQVEREINASRPIIAGISPDAKFLPSDVAEHAVVIVGYDDSNDANNPDLIVNDPFPYDLADIPPAYLQYGGAKLQDGQYRISYSAFRHRLNWNNAVANIF